MSQESTKAKTAQLSSSFIENQLRSGESFLTKRQFAALLQVTERTIDRWLLDGELPPETKLAIGGSVRFRPLVLEQWINSSQSGRVD